MTGELSLTRAQPAADGAPSAAGLPTRPTQPFILSGYIDEQQAAIRRPPP